MTTHARPLPATYEALRAATDGLLRQVVEHHQPTVFGLFGGWECSGCDLGPYSERPDWPCSTTELIAEHLGVALTLPTS